MKRIIFLVIVLITLSTVSAYNIEVDGNVSKQRYTNILKDIEYNKTRNIDTIHIGSDFNSEKAYAWYWFRYKGHRVTKSIIYLNQNLDNQTDSFVECVVLHELGHHDQARNKGIFNLSESYATQWAIDNGCEDLKFYQNYGQKLSN